jgi:hypothetical protein
MKDCKVFLVPNCYTCYIYIDDKSNKRQTGDKNDNQGNSKVP